MDKEKKTVIDSRQVEMPIWEKAFLTLDEAALYFNIGTARIRALTDSDDSPYVLWIGKKRLIKKKLFEEFLNNQFSI